MDKMKEEDNLAQCKSCMFAHKARGYNSFECRRHSPILQVNPHQPYYITEDNSKWPLVNGDWGCGDFKEENEA